MVIRQISIFLENKGGRLVEITKTLGDHSINIKALSVADTHDFGILRLIVDKPEKAEQLLFDKGFTVSSAGVIVILVKNEPGGLVKALDILANSEISIEYVYTFLTKEPSEAMIALKVNDSQKALNVLTQNSIKVLNSIDIENI